MTHTTAQTTTANRADAGRGGFPPFPAAPRLGRHFYCERNQMRRTWIKLYVDQCLRGSMIAELTPEQRWMFVGLLLLAGDSPVPGVVYRRKNEDGVPVGYSDIVLADTLGVDESAVHPGLSRMVEKSKVSVDPHGVITISNWGKYQSEYERTRNAPSRVVQKYGVEGDVDRDVDIEHHIERKPEISFNFDTKTWDGISKEDLDDWAKRYPSLDISGQLAEMRDWLLDHPTRAKLKYRSFITRWMKKSLADPLPPSRRPAADMRVGQSPKRDHDDEYWANVRAKHADGKRGDE